MPGGVAPCQTGGRDHPGSRALPGGAAADVADIVGVAVADLDGKVATGRHFRDRDHHRLGPQVQPGHRVGRVTVGRGHGGVAPGEDLGVVPDGVERRLELAAVPVDGELVHYCVVHHDRQAEDEGGLRRLDGADDTGPTGLRQRRLCQCGDAYQARCTDEVTLQHVRAFLLRPGSALVSWAGMSRGQSDAPRRLTLEESLLRASVARLM
jgi:hypothetical protein